MSANKDLVVVEGSVKNIKFTITDKDTGVVVDVSACTASLVIKNTSGTLLTVANGSIDKTDGATGILRALCTFSADGRYTGYLTITIGATTDIIPFGVKIKNM